MTERPGRSTRHRAAILRSTINPGFYGRGLTPEERRALRALG